MELTWPYLELMRLPRAWDPSTGAGVLVAVLDSGVSAGHPDLQDAVVPGIDWSTATPTRPTTTATATARW